MKFVNKNQRAIVYGGTVENDDNPSEFYQVIAEKTSKEHGFALEDLKPVKYWLCSVGQNSNKDYWGDVEMTYAAPTIALKPINVNHSRNDDGTPIILIGVNYEGIVEVNPETEVNSILAKAVLFQYLYENLKVFQDICADIDSGIAFASMECVFDEYYAVHPKTGELVDSVQTEDDFAKELKAGNIARKFGNPLLIGSAFLKGKPPADPSAAIYPDDLQVYSVDDGKISYLQPKKKDIDSGKATLKDIIKMHVLSHTAYNQIKRYGAYKGWTIKEAKEIHTSTSKSLNDIGVVHNTQLSSGKPTIITMPMVKQWFKGVDVYVGGELAIKPATAYNPVPIYNGDIPVSEYYESDDDMEHLYILTKHRSSKDREVNRDDCPIEGFLQNLTKNVEYWKKVTSLLYNKESTAVAHLAIAMKLRQRFNCVVKFGSINTLDLEDTCWIESHEKVVRLTTDGLWFSDLEHSEHDFSKVVETVDANYSDTSSLIAERYGVAYLNRFQELIQCGVDTPLPKIESMFSMASGQTLVEGSLYLRKKMENPSVLLWKVNADSWGSNSTEEVDVPNKIIKSLPMNTIVEGYLSDSKFYIYDVLMFGEYVAEKSYKERYELLQKIANHYIEPVETVITTASNLIESTCEIEAGYGAIARLENSTYYGDGYFELRPTWVFSAKVLDKIGNQYKIGNDLIYGFADYRGDIKIGEEIEITCDWIIPDECNYMLQDIKILQD